MRVLVDAFTDSYSIKHYRIRKYQDGQVGVSDKKVFSSVVDLVAHYQGHYVMDHIIRRAQVHSQGGGVDGFDHSLPLS